jgi:hypothetical protein
MVCIAIYFMYVYVLKKANDGAFGVAFSVARGKRHCTAYEVIKAVHMLLPPPSKKAMTMHIRRHCRYI